jgi:IstB-like ATP binding protein
LAGQGYIPFDPQAANLMFMLVSRRYERASLIITSNKPFSAWGEIFGDDAVAVAMVDRLVHHAEILSLKGDSYRLKDRDLGPPRRRSATRLTALRSRHDGDLRHDREMWRSDAQRRTLRAARRMGNGASGARCVQAPRWLNP